METPVYDDEYMNVSYGITYDSAYMSDSFMNVSFDNVPLIRQPAHMIVIFALAYGLVFIFALLGNILVIAVIFKDPTMRNVTNYFILNLAVADILVAIFVLPITLLANIFSGWRFGAFMCKTTPYIQSVVQCASVNTLAAIAFDRYQAICYSRHSKTTSCAYRTTIIGIWLFAFCIMIPLVVFYEHYYHPDYPDVPMCHQLWPTTEGQKAYFLTALFIICYLLPLSMIMLCYILIGIKVCRRDAPGIQATGRLVIYKSKVKVLKMLAVIVLLFALSWLPLYAVYLRLYFGGEVSGEANETIFSIVLPISQWLGSSNSGVNPIIYCFFSKKYRRGFRHILHCRVRHLPLWRQNTTNRSVSTRYVNVDNSSVPYVDNNHDATVNNGISRNKFMVVLFNNGRMTVSFRKENGSDESSF